MRWFKLFTDTRDDEAVAAFIEDAGMAGFGVLMATMTVIAGRMDAGAAPSATYPLTWWGREFNLHINQVVKLFLAMAAHGLALVECIGGDGVVTARWMQGDAGVDGKSPSGRIRVTMHNMLKLQDEYTTRQARNAAETRDKLPSRTEVEQKTTPTPPSRGDVVVGGFSSSTGEEEKPSETTRPLPPVAGTESPAMADTPLIFPATLLEGERKAITVALDSLQPDVAQAILDELTGTLLAGNEVKNKAGWCRAVAGKAASSGFFPERGAAVADRRRQVAMIPKAEPPKEKTISEVEESIRAAQEVVDQANLSPELAAIVKRMGNVLLVRERDMANQGQEARP